MWLEWIYLTFNVYKLAPFGTLCRECEFWNFQEKKNKQTKYFWLRFFTKWKKESISNAALCFLDTSRTIRVNEKELSLASDGSKPADQTPSCIHICSMRLHYEAKVSNCSIKSCGRSWSAHEGTIYAYTKAILEKRFYGHIEFHLPVGFSLWQCPKLVRSSCRIKWSWREYMFIYRKKSSMNRQTENLMLSSRNRIRPETDP